MADFPTDRGVVDPTTTSTNTIEAQPPAKRQRVSSPQQDTTTTEMKMSDPLDRVVEAGRGQSDSREAEVGILHFVNDSNPGFCGTLKQRYTDFLVHEVDPNGVVIHLTNDKAPQHRPQGLKDSQPKPAPEPEVKIEGKPQTTPAPISVPKAEEKPTSDEMHTIPTVAFASQDTSESVTNSTEQKSSAEAVEAAGALLSTSAEVKLEPNATSNDIKAEDSEAKPVTDVKEGPDTLENRQTLSTYFGNDFTTEIFGLYGRILGKPTAKPNVFGVIISEPITDRPLRGRIHSDMRRIFNSRLETEAVHEGRIRVAAARPAQSGPNSKPRAPNPRAQNNNGQSKGKVGWDELGGQMLHFTLYKENKDTMEVIGFLASRLKIKPKDFDFAGTKDRRAVTTQRVSVYRQHATTLAKLNPMLRNSRIGNFKYEKNRLELGELQGNQFTITLRECTFSGEAGLNKEARLVLANEIISDSMKHLQRDGFLNYFGLQRFGTFGIGTDEVGKKILQGNFKGAVWDILAVNDTSLAYALQNGPISDQVNRDDIDRASAIHIFREGGKAQLALDKLPRRFSGETAVIRSLSSGNKKGDYLAALMNISRNLRTMYVHAYQSRVWNMAASERWSRYGSKVIEGDLVYVNTPAVVAASSRVDVDENGEVVIHPAAGDVAFNRDDIFERARPLSAKEAESGEYTIYDIVLPTPGFDIEYPQNDIGDFYKEYMGSEVGGKLDPANMRRNERDFSLSGSYRKLMARVGKDLTYEVKVYFDENEQMVETDLEKLDNNKPLRNNNRQFSKNSNYNDRQGSNNGGFNDRSWNNNSRDSRQARIDDTKDVRQCYVGTAAHNAWLNAPAMLAAQEKSEAEAAESMKLVEKPVASTKQPLFKETFIETSAENEGRRTGNKLTTIRGVDGIETGEVSNTEGEPKSLESITESATSVQLSSPRKRQSNDISQETPVEVVEATKAEPEIPPPKIAVVVKFALGSSQYATMALRELMKAGGVRQYKPDFSNAR